MIAVILGAIGAHLLKERLDVQQLNSFEVGVKYQMYHGLALLILGVGAKQFPFSLKLFNTFIICGVAAFSVSIYLLALQDLIGINLKFLGPITPIGGTLLIAAWIILLVKIIRSNPKKSA